MSSVDERIVQMQFDNAKFENGVSTTINSIDKLKQSLQFNDVGKGFDNITKAAGAVDLSAVQNSIGAIEQKFSIVSEAIRRNVGKVIDGLIGKAAQLANALFVAPRTDGFREYELKMDSVQTILSTTDATLEDVNARLDELNTYADKTIYSFSDMTQSIGKFTNAGVNLDDAVLAIKGISNAAAKSGAKTQQASSAMYNFAQALGTGALMMQDWKSIELAGMASPEFKQQLVDTALALGTLVKQGDRYVTTTTNGQGSTASFSESLEGFRDTLSSRWITNDVLIETLKKYTDETTELGKKAYAAATEVKTFSQLIDTAKEAMGSGWSQTFEIVIGDFGEAKEIFTALSGLFDSIINKTAAVRNGFLKAWKDDGGREKLVKHLETIISQVDILSDKILKNLLGSKYNKILGETNDILDDTSKKIDNLTEAERKFIEEVWKEGKHGTGEQRVEEARQAGVNYERVQDVLNKITSNEMTIDSLAENTAENTEKTANSVEQIGDTKWSKALYNVLTTVKFLNKTLLNIGETIFNVGKLFIQAFVEEFAIDDVTLGIKQFARYLMQTTGRIKDWSKDSSGLLTIFRGIFKFANALWTVFKPFLIFAGKAIRQLATWLVKIGEAIDNWSKKIDENSRLYRAWNAIKKIAGKVKDAFLDMFNQLGEAAETNPKIKQLRDFFSGIADKVKDIFDSGFTKFVEFLERIADGDISFNNIKEMVSNFGKGESKIGKFFDKFKDGFGSFDKFNDIWSKVKSKLSFEELATVGTKAFIWSRNLAAGVVAGLKSIDWDRVIKFMKFGAFMIIMFQIMSLLNGLKRLTKGFDTHVFGILDGVANVLNSFATKIAAGAIKTIAESVAILGATLFVLALLPAERLRAVADSITLVIMALSLLSYVLMGGGGLIKKIEKTVKIGNVDTTFLGLAGILFTLFEIFKFISTSEADMGKGLLILGGILGELLGFLFVITLINKMAGTQAPLIMKSLSKLAKAVLIMGLVIGGLAIVAKEVGQEAMDDAAQALFEILLLMSAVSALVFVKGIEKLPVIAGGLMLLSVAIGLLTPALLALAVIPGKKLWNIVGALSALMVVLGVVSRFMRGSTLVKFSAGLILIAVACIYMGKHLLVAVPGILGLAAAMVVLGVVGSVLALIAPWMMIAAGAIKAMAIACLIGSVAFLIFATSIKIIADSLPNLADGVIYLADRIKDNAPQVAYAIETVIGAIIDAIKKNSWKILGAISDFLVALAEFLIDPSHGVVGVLLDVLEAVAGMLGRIIGRLVDIILEFIIELLYALGDAFENRKSALGDAIAYFVGAVVNTLVTMLAAVLDGAVKGLINYDLHLRDKVAHNITKGEQKFVKGTGQTLNEITKNKSAFKDFRNAGENTGTAGMTAYMQGYDSSLQSTLMTNLDGLSGKDAAKALFSNFEQSMTPVQGPAQFDMSAISFDVTGDPDTSSILSKMKNFGVDAGGSFTEGINSAISYSDTGAFDYANGWDIQKYMSENGIEGGESFDSGVYGSIFDGDMEDMSFDAADMWSMPNEYEDAGDDDAKSFIAGIEENKGPIRRKAIQAAAGAVEVFNEKEIEFFGAGINSMNGFIEGIQWKMQELHDVALEAANVAKRAFSGKDGLDEHSPSKVFMTYGEYASEGFIVGLTSYADRITESSSEVANSAVDALKTPLQHITDIIDGTLDVDPTIRPVMDLTDIQNGSQMIDGMFANRSVQLAGINDKLNGLNVDANLRDKKSANNDIVEELRTLRSGFAEMSQRLDNMQVVMDSGQLVGAISAPMDRSLGNRSIRKGRRN